MRIVVMTLMAALLAACGDSSTKSGSSGSGGVPDEAKRAADALTGGEDTSTNPVCKLFTPAELEPYVGEPLVAPRNAAGGSGCQWLAKDESGDVLIQIVSKEFHEDPRLAEGYRGLPELGPKASVSPFMDGWMARAIASEESVNAGIAGQGASPDQAVALLKEVIKRRVK